MSNVLDDEKQQQIRTLGRLGWSLRQIEQATGVRRETASAYLKAGGIPVRERGGRPGVWPPKPATTTAVSTDPGAPKPAIGRAAIHQGHRVIYREAHALLEDLADATLDGTRKGFFADLTAVPLLIIDDLGMRKLPHTAAEDLLEVIMRRYERASTLLTSNRPVDDWGKLLSDTAAVTALLDRLLHHAHVLKCGPRSWLTKVHTDLRPEEATK